MLILLGTAAYDLGRAIQRPAFRYWPRIMADAAAQFKTTAPLAGFLSAIIGGAISIHAMTAIAGLGASTTLAGIILSSLALRSVSVIMVLLAMSASMGAGTVTQIGAMRVSDEIDALESIAIDSHTYLIGTRILTGLLVAGPLMIFGIATCFIGGWITALVNGVDAGAFGDFFWRGIAPIDFVYVLIETTSITLVMVAICASQGYRATGGPVGVGLAVGRSMDIIVGVGMVLNLVFSFFFWGTTDTVKL